MTGNDRGNRLTNDQGRVKGEVAKAITKPSGETSSPTIHDFTPANHISMVRLNAEVNLFLTSYRQGVVWMASRD